MARELLLPLRRRAALSSGRKGGDPDCSSAVNSQLLRGSETGGAGAAAAAESSKPCMHAVGLVCDMAFKAASTELRTSVLTKKPSMEADVMAWLCRSSGSNPPTSGVGGDGGGLALRTDFTVVLKGGEMPREQQRHRDARPPSFRRRSNREATTHSALLAVMCSGPTALLSLAADVAAAVAVAAAAASFFGDLAVAAQSHSSFFSVTATGGLGWS
ncbi:hypothetical protein ACSSS7_006150 [Eimeria intestinalis]